MIDVVRKLIQERLQELGITMAEASKRLGHNAAYVQQFLKRGSPKVLPEQERLILAEILQVAESELRGFSAPLPTKNYVRSVSGIQSPVDRRLQGHNVAQGIGPSATPDVASPLFGSVDLPVYSTVHGVGSELIISQRAVGRVARPSVLMHVEEAYALIVATGSMSPALQIGATALVNPHLPPRVGDICLFRSPAEGAPDKILIKEYRGESETVWKTRKLHPETSVILKKSDWQVCHRIVGSYFP